MRIRLFILMGLISASVIFYGCGSSSPTTPASIPTAIEGVEPTGGETGVEVDTQFQYTFQKDVNESSVNTSTFFIVETPSSSQTTTSTTFDETICNAGNALSATVGCNSSTVCYLSPTSNLSNSASYNMCLTPGSSSGGIWYANGTPFEGSTIQFATTCTSSDDFSTDSIKAGCWTLYTDNNANYSESFLSITGGVLTFNAPNYMFFPVEMGGDGSYSILKQSTDQDITITVYFPSATNMSTHGGLFDAVGIAIYPPNIWNSALVWTIDELGGQDSICAFYYSPAGIGNLTFSTCGTATDHKWLRMVKSGNSLSGYYSDDGSTFIQVSNTITVTEADAYNITLSFYTGNRDGTFTVDVDSFNFDVGKATGQD